METIPDNVKSETFNTIPTQIKVDLFNNIVKTAFPNFDNLIVASWNVVSVYANIGSDFPELHKAVVELKGALEEFESAYAPPRTKAGKGRKEATPNQQNGENGSRTATPVKEARSTPVPVARSNVTVKTQADQHYQEDEDDSQHQVPPPRVLQTSQQHQDEGVKQDECQPGPPAALTSDRAGVRAHSVPRYTSENNLTTAKLTPISTQFLPKEQHLQPHRERVGKVCDRPADPYSTLSTYEHLQAPGSELMRKRQEYTASLSKSNRNSTGAALGHHTQEEDENEQYVNGHVNTHEQRRPSSGGSQGQMQGAFWGSSVLGAKKPTGSAPVAPMLHTRKDGGRANEEKGLRWKN